jgi:methylmalonyl-CoA mutase N-terminal domain/subunit
MDEALALPSEKSVRIALRTQQIIAQESGVTRSVDPLGGSYMVEALTHEVKRRAYEYFDLIQAQGGVVPAIEKGFLQREIADAAYRDQEEVERGERKIVGVNDHAGVETITIPLLELDAAGQKRHLERLNRVRRQRSSREVSQGLARLESAARGSENLMPPILDAVRAYATLGEICGVLRQVFGEYRASVLV